MEPTYGPEEFERHRRGPPDQSQRLHGDPHGVGRQRRARAWVVVAVALALVAAFAVMVATGGGENSQSPDTAQLDRCPTVTSCAWHNS